MRFGGRGPEDSRSQQSFALTNVGDAIKTPELAFFMNHILARKATNEVRQKYQMVSSCAEEWCQK